MSQRTYQYKIFHTKEADLKRMIEQIDFVHSVSVQVTVSLEEDTIGIKNPHRSAVSINIDDSDFEKLDTRLEAMFEQVWFDF